MGNSSIIVVIKCIFLSCKTKPRKYLFFQSKVLCDKSPVVVAQLRDVRQTEIRTRTEEGIFCARAG